MTQDKINKIFQSDLGQQCMSLYTTSDDRVFIRPEEAKKHANGELDPDTKPLADKTVTEWFDEDF